MQEFWFCETCKSMNRASSQQCYSCHAPKSLATMATVADRQPGVVLTPGLDEEHREVAWTLMFRQRYIPAWQLGYVAAAMLLLVVALGALTAALELALMVSRHSLTPVSPVDSNDSILLASILFLVATGLLAALVHSVFLGLTSMDCPALGSGSPRFMTARAALWWIESWLWAIRAGLAFVGPPLLALFAMALGGIAFGLPMGFIWAVMAYFFLGDPITSLGKPSRLLKDLWDRLAVPGSADSRIVTLWSVSWGTARGVDFAISAIIYIGILVFVFLGFVGAGPGFSAQESDNASRAAIVLGVLIVVVQWIADGIALCLLAQITIGLAKRQRIREEWVLGGLDPALARAEAAGWGTPGAMMAVVPAGPSQAPQPATPPGSGPPNERPPFPWPGSDPWPPTPAAPFAPPPGYPPAQAAPFAPPPGYPPAQAAPFAPPPSYPPTPAAPFAPPPGYPPAQAAFAPPGPATQPGPAPDRPVMQPSSGDLSRYGRTPDGSLGSASRADSQPDQAPEAEPQTEDRPDQAPEAEPQTEDRPDPGPEAEPQTEDRPKKAQIEDLGWGEGI